MIVPRISLGVAALGGKLYAVGGYDTAGTAVNSAEVYDPIDNSWNLIDPMNFAREWLGVAALGGKLYAVGGCVLALQRLSFGRSLRPYR